MMTSTMLADDIPRELIVHGFGNVFSTGPLNTPIKLPHTFKHSLGVSAFYSCNAILNIHAGNDMFYYGEDKEIQIPFGCYEVDEIGAYLKEQIARNDSDNKKTQKETKFAFKLAANNNTLRCEIESSYITDFTKPNNIGNMLGFMPQILEPNKKYASDKEVEITKASTIFVETNITEGAYRNNAPCHSIYHIPVSVAPGYNLEDSRAQVRHFPIRVSEIRDVTIRLVDIRGELINISKDTRTIVCLEIKSEPW